MKKFTPHSFKKALAAENAARDQLAAAEALRAQAAANLRSIEAIQLEWESLGDQYERFKSSVERAASTVEELRQNAKAIEQIAISRVGELHGPLQPVVEVAIEAAKGNLALPILEQGLQARREELNAHVRTMRIFADKHDIPGDVFAELANN
ncbi:MAG TPA: hypothetical protein VH170_05860 [Chthoniobacterales bacterium]|jgi:DNA repair exonuclease SbcCD ATPase subunit|nr:hypothetical protein [Chthoniobacterales bacterium]